MSAQTSGRHGARPRHRRAATTTEEFWALKDVSFEVKRGEVLGIIGRNGAGKSTLLKILSRITEPTEGRVTIKGRVASLLEVGTGFHPELTGRENIYLNGAILGMSRAEIRRKFDEIVAFSGVEKFLDTPVKRYSSGMYVRLAFAVAAHLEPEILIVDEVLAVGDAEFQKKCLGKMGEVAKARAHGLFVSHNMAAVQTLCQRCLRVASGRSEFLGVTTEAIGLYLNEHARSSVFRKDASRTGRPELVAASTEPLKKAEENRTLMTLHLAIQCARKMNVNVDVRVRDGRGTPVGVATIGATMPLTPLSLSPGITGVAMTIDVTCLAVGTYTLSVDISTPWVECHDRIEDCVEFSIEPEHRPGLLHPLRGEWGYGSVSLPSTFSRQN